jgi:Uma2 family endonuclease
MTLSKLDGPRPPRRVYYPVRDGKPMAETDKHADVMVYVREALRLHFADRADRVYVSGNNFVYWEEGNPQARVSPDVYVVFGVPQRQRDSYKSWEEGRRLPSFVLEVTSKKTRREDVTEKKDRYEKPLHVAEYFQFDPTGDYLTPRLQGLTLAMDHYEEIPLEQGDRLYSRQLGLYLVMVGEDLRLWDPREERFLPTLVEADRRAEQERFRANAEARARVEAEAEAARLRTELEALRRQAGTEQS